MLQEADTEASESERTPRARPTLPWNSLRAVVGIMHGEPADAVVDTDRLYDG